MVNFAMEVVIQRANIPAGKSFDLVSAGGNYRATLEIQKWCSPSASSSLLSRDLTLLSFYSLILITESAEFHHRCKIFANDYSHLRFLNIIFRVVWG